MSGTLRVCFTLVGEAEGQQKRTSAPKIQAWAAGAAPRGNRRHCWKVILADLMSTASLNTVGLTAFVTKLIGSTSLRIYGRTLLSPSPKLIFSRTHAQWSGLRK